jgi:hypothetical protein
MKSVYESLCHSMAKLARDPDGNREDRSIARHTVGQSLLRIEHPGIAGERVEKQYMGKRVNA